MECRNCLMIPIPQIDEYIIVNYLQTMTISDTLDGEQIRVKGLNQKPYVCVIHPGDLCKSLYDQMSYHLRRSANSFDLLIYLRRQQATVGFVFPSNGTVFRVASIHESECHLQEPSQRLLPGLLLRW